MSPEDRYHAPRCDEYPYTQSHHALSAYRAPTYLPISSKAAGSRGRGEAARERCEVLRRQIAQLVEDTAVATASVRALQTERALKLSGVSSSSSSSRLPPAVD